MYLYLFRLFPAHVTPPFERHGTVLPVFTTSISARRGRWHHVQIPVLRALTSNSSNSMSYRFWWRFLWSEQYFLDRFLINLTGFYLLQVMKSGDCSIVCTMWRIYSTNLVSPFSLIKIIIFLFDYIILQPVLNSWLTSMGCFHSTHSLLGYIIAPYYYSILLFGYRGFNVGEA